MNILHVTQNYFPSVGGPQYVLQHASEKLVEYYGDTVQVCTSNSLYAPEAVLYKKVQPSNEVLNGVEIHRLPFNRWHYPLIKYSGKVYGKLFNKSLPASISKKRSGLDSPAMIKMMNESDADVIMAKTIIYNFADYPLWRFNTNKPKPFVLYGALHLHVELSEKSPLLARAKACDAYIANTVFEKNKLIEYGVDAGKIFPVGIGIDLESMKANDTAVQAFRMKHGIEDSDVVIGYVGRLVKGKGVAVLIDAFRKIHRENKRAKLLLAGGTTEYVAEIKRIIKEEQLPIILIEDFEESEKAVIYHALDIFVLASQSESFGIVFLEAWACKKPVIGTRMGAIASLLSEGVDSLLFESKDADSLYAKLQLLLNDKEQREKLGENGFQKVVENYTWPVILKRYREAYLYAIEHFKNKYRNYKTAKSSKQTVS